jgi:outer membrane protein OmpA-like peptidoglycan-associated protein
MRLRLILIALPALGLTGARAAAAPPDPRELAWSNVLDPLPEGLDPFRRRETGRLSVRVEPSAFSPNSDGRQDSTFFFVSTEGGEEALQWMIRIRDPRGKAVRVLTGRGSPPGLIEWDGKDAKRRPVPEANYTVEALVSGPDARMSSVPALVAVDLTPPKASLVASSTTFSPDGDGQDETVTLEIDAEDAGMLLGWNMNILSQGDPPAVVFASSGTFSNGLVQVPWGGMAQDVRAPVPNGAYTCSLVVEDTAGNRVSTAPVTVEVRSSAKAVLNRILSSLSVQTLRDGYRVLIPSSKIFTDSRGLRVAESTPEVDQAVYLVRAFPDHRVVVNGYVGSEKTPARRMEVSSGQAWALYRLLVKAGVRATRLEVHGRGGRYRSKNRRELRLIRPPAASSAAQVEPKGKP